ACEMNKCGRCGGAPVREKRLPPPVPTRRFRHQSRDERSPAEGGERGIRPPIPPSIRMATEPWEGSMPRIPLLEGVSVHCAIDDYLWPWDDKTPVLMMHGFARNASFWTRWVPTIAERPRIY